MRYQFLLTNKNDTIMAKKRFIVFLLIMAMLPLSNMYVNAAQIPLNSSVFITNLLTALFKVFVNIY